MITWENYEEYMVMHADGELLPEQEQALMSFLYEHPDLQAELTAFTMTKMVPDTTETYALKDTLLRPETAAKPVVMALPLWRRYAVAAAVVAMLAVPGYRYMMQPSVTNGQEYGAVAVNTGKTLPVAGNNNPATVATATSAAEQVTHVGANSPAVAAVATLPAAQSRPVRATRTTKAVRVGTTNTPRTTADSRVLAIAATDISPLEVVATQPIKISEKNFVPVVTNTLPLAIEYTESNDESVAAGSLLDKVPMSDTRRNGMKSFVADVATGYSRVSNVTQEIAQASLSFKIGKKQLKVSF